MIYSMTGYGGAKGDAAGLHLSIELKSVNNRYLDVSVRLPRNLMFAEETVKAAVSRHISRGKVDVYISLDGTAESGLEVKVNQALAESYISAIRQISEAFSLPETLDAVSISRFPDVLSVEKQELNKEEIAAGIETVLESALREFDEMRLREGEKLAQDITGRLAAIEGFVSYVEGRSPQTVEEYRQRLYAKLSEILENRSIDEQRVLTEVAILADKLAVDEETVRLRSHISQFRDFLVNGSPIGRKMDFLIQEFNREANTIGSKCADAEIAKVVVDLKSEIEKIREQVQNIE